MVITDTRDAYDTACKKVNDARINVRRAETDAVSAMMYKAQVEADNDVAEKAKADSDFIVRYDAYVTALKSKETARGEANSVLAAYMKERVA